MFVEVAGKKLVGVAFFPPTILSRVKVFKSIMTRVAFISKLDNFFALQISGLVFLGTTVIKELIRV